MVYQGAELERRLKQIIINHTSDYFYFLLTNTLLILKVMSKIMEV